MSKKRKTVGWILNQKFVHLDALANFMRDSLHVSDTEIRKRFKGVGAIKLLVLSGFLVNGKEVKAKKYLKALKNGK